MNEIEYKRGQHRAASISRRAAVNHNDGTSIKNVFTNKFDVQGKHCRRRQEPGEQGLKEIRKRTSLTSTQNTPRRQAPFFRTVYCSLQHLATHQPTRVLAVPGDVQVIMDEIVQSMKVASEDAAVQRAGCVAVFELCKDMDADEVLSQLKASLKHEHTQTVH